MEENKTFDINGLLSSTSMDKVTSEGTGFENLPDGYYLCDVKSAVYGASKKSGLPMVTIRFKVAEDGIVTEVDEAGNPFNARKSGTKDREFSKFYTLKDADTVRRFVSDMLKFENKETVGEPLFDASCFGSVDMIEDALSLITEEAGVASRLYVQVETSINKQTNEPSTYYTVLSWKRVGQLKIEEGLD